jgi:hypothetical protein
MPSSPQLAEPLTFIRLARLRWEAKAVWAPWSDANTVRGEKLAGAFASAAGAPPWPPPWLCLALVF